ncbi:MAG: tyrosine-type recombinase/integrase [Flavobacteriaceae bacterium]
MYLTKPKDRPFYYIVYYDESKRTRRSTKCKTKSEALLFLTEFKNNFKKQKLEKIITFKDFKSEYLIYSEKRFRPSTIDALKTTFNLFEKAIGNPQLRKIDIRIVDNFISDTYNRSASSASLCYRTLRATFNKALQWNYITTNPFNNIKAPKIEKKLPVFIPNNEFALIIKNTEKDFLSDLFITAYNTGMRAGEIINLKWSWIDFDEQIITIKNSNSFRTKSGNERIIPINETLKKVLNTRFPKVINISKDEYIFFKVKGLRLNVDYVSKNFKKICRKLQLNEKYHFHTIRHSFASNLVQQGVDLYIVKELLGHSDLKTTQIYSHLKRSNLIEAVSKLNKNVS